MVVYCFGSLINSIVGFAFLSNRLPQNHYHDLIKTYPIQLYESAFGLFLFGTPNEIQERTSFLHLYLDILGL